MEDEIKLDEMIYRDYSQTLRRSSDDKRTTAIINTADRDRHGTIIEPAGIDLKNYKSNPVVLINHDRSLLAGVSDSIELNKDRVIAHMSDDNWDHDDPEIERYFRKVKKGIMRTTSIGFIPKEIERIEDDEGNTETIRIAKSELVEYSYVTIPSNTGALVLEKSFDADVLKHLREEIKTLSNEVLMLRKTGVKLLESDMERFIQNVLKRVSPGTPQGAPVQAYVPPKPQTRNYIEKVDESELVNLVVKTLNKKLGKL